MKNHNSLTNNTFTDNYGQVGFVVQHQKTTQTKRSKIRLSSNLIYFIHQGKMEVITREFGDWQNNNHLLLIPKSNLLLRKELSTTGSNIGISIPFSNETLVDYLLRKGVIPDHIVENHQGPEVIEKDKFLRNFEKKLIELSKNVEGTPFRGKVNLETLFDYLKTNKPIQFNRFVRNALLQQDQHSFEQAVNNKVDAEVSVPELAFLTNMSLSVFKRKFFKVFQTTPKQYFIKHKMEKALGLLQNQKKPTQIALLLGYDNLNAFSAAFKKNYGLSPRNYVNSYLLSTQTCRHNETYKWN